MPLDFPSTFLAIFLLSRWWLCLQRKDFFLPSPKAYFIDFSRFFLHTLATQLNHHGFGFLASEVFLSRCMWRITVIVITLYSPFFYASLIFPTSLPYRLMCVLPFCIFSRHDWSRLKAENGEMCSMSQFTQNKKNNAKERIKKFYFRIFSSSTREQFVSDDFYNFYWWTLFMEYVINIQLIEKWYWELKIYKSDILARITYLPLIEAYQIMYMFDFWKNKIHAWNCNYIYVWFLIWKFYSSRSYLKAKV